MRRCSWSKVWAWRAARLVAVAARLVAAAALRAWASRVARSCARVSLCLAAAAFFAALSAALVWVSSVFKADPCGGLPGPLFFFSGGGTAAVGSVVDDDDDDEDDPAPSVGSVHVELGSEPSSLSRFLGLETLGSEVEGGDAPVAVMVLVDAVLDLC